jgi:calreticulin
MLRPPTALFLLLLSSAVESRWFYEDFSSAQGWTKGKNKPLEISQGGMKTQPDASFFSFSKSFPTFSNEGKTLVFSFSISHPQNIDCGGGYLKLLPAFELADFDGETPYNIMFGPDICGATKKIHLIFSYKGKNLLWKKEPRAESDTFTHFYTLVLNPDNTYEMLVDFTKKESGRLEDDWEFLAPKTIVDSSDKKPNDWVDTAEIPNPEDKKPGDWDVEPATIPDPDATKPDDWDEEEDGEWDAPTIPNPKFKGEWKPRMIPNPAYKGEWKPRQIANPDYSLDDKLYLFKDFSVVGVDIWQVKSGSVFDSIILTDSLEDAKSVYDPTILEKERAAKDQEEKEKAATTPKAPEEEEEEDDDDEEEEEEKAKAKHDEL